ncbi:MAG: hypothetical protein IJQ53_08225 [Clostridia bacterium]|nr:hypothetical protein [Clostridia bacterium]
MAENEEKRAGKPLKIADSRYRKVVAYLLSFVLSLFLLLATVCAVAFMNALSERHIINTLGDEYYEGVLNTVVAAAEDITMPTGIDISVVKGVFELENVKRDVNGYISAAFSGKEYVPDNEDADNRLYINVSEFLDSHDVTLVADKKETIRAYIEEVNSEYAQYTKLPGLGIVSKYRAKYLKIALIAFIVLAGASVIIGAVIIKMYRHPHRGMRFIAYALGGTALMSLVAPLVLLISGKYKGLNLTPEHFYRFAIRYIDSVLYSFIAAAAIWLALTAGCVTAIHFMRKKLLDKSK